VAIVRTLYESPLLRIGEFHCRGGDPRWRACNSIGEGHHLVFPRTAVFIAHEGGEPVLADPSVAVVHRSHERYRRAIADPAGDHCVWVVPNVALARSLERLDDERPVPRFVRTGRRAYATQTLVAWTLARGGPIDPMVVEEEMLGVVADALGRVEETPPSGAVAREVTSRRFTSPAGFARAPGGLCTSTGTKFACGVRHSWSPLDLGLAGGSLWVPTVAGRTWRIRVADPKERTQSRWPAGIFVAEPGAGSLWLLDFGGTRAWRIAPSAP